MTPFKPRDDDAEFEVVITPKRPWLDVPLREIWTFRYLAYLLVKRDFISLYKQTILGPTWILLQPLLLALMFTLVFGQIAKLSTDGLPQILFYLAGVTCWTYFADILTKTSETFFQNASVFGKVYFPRLLIPISIVASNLIKFVIQFFLFILLVIWFLFQSTPIEPNATMILLPLFLLLLAGIALGCGLIICALTTKYRDLRFLLTFGVQLLMYATPVIYPLSMLPEKYSFWININPISPIIEGVRFAFLGTGSFSMAHLSYSFLVMLGLVFVGVIAFTRVEQNFMDTV